MLPMLLVCLTGGLCAVVLMWRGKGCDVIHLWEFLREWEFAGLGWVHPVFLCGEIGQPILQVVLIILCVLSQSMSHVRMSGLTYVMVACIP